MEHLTPAQATVISAIISGAIALLVCVINTRQQNKKMMNELKQRDLDKQKADAVMNAELKMWMKSVEEKLETHNRYAETLGEIKMDVAVIKNDIQTLKQA